MVLWLSRIRSHRREAKSSDSIAGPKQLIAESPKANNLTVRRQTYRQKAHRSRPRTTRARATSSHNNSFKPVADCIPGSNLRRLRFGLHVERESLWLAA